MPRPANRAKAQPVILVVDDELDVLMPLAEALQHLIPETKVYPARSADEALRFASENQVDLVITDYRMPGMSGEDLLRILDTLKGRPPSILMTAYPSEGLAFRAVHERRVAAIVTKPFDARMMVEKARQLLAQRGEPGPGGKAEG